MGDGVGTDAPLGWTTPPEDRSGAIHMDTITLGVEEEFLVVDAENRRAGVPRSHELLAPAATDPGRRGHPGAEPVPDRDRDPRLHLAGRCSAHLVRLRGGLAAAAGRSGSGVAASGTHPFTSWRDQQRRPQQRALQPHGRPVPDRRPPAGHLRLPRARRHRGPRPRRRHHEPGPPLAADPAGPLGQLAVLAGHRHRLRQLPPTGLAALADLGHAAGPGQRPRVRRARPGPRP